ncbi:MAG: shikimate kinase [Chitinophagaceae bacterium]
MRIFLIGFMGSGKSHWGKLLASRLQLPHFDLDQVIEADQEMSVTQIFEQKGEEKFRLLEKQQLEKLIETHPGLVLSTGGGTPCFFNNIELMKTKGIVVWLNPSIDTLLTRLLQEKEKRPLIKNIPEKELRAFLLKKMNDRRLYYEQAAVQINEDQVTLDECLQLILHA